MLKSKSFRQSIDRPFGFYCDRLHLLVPGDFILVFLFGFDALFLRLADGITAFRNMEV